MGRGKNETGFGRSGEAEKEEREKRKEKIGKRKYGNSQMGRMNCPSSTFCRLRFYPH
jgi:hypothetical protein